MFTISLSILLFTIIYFEVTTTVDLHPFNAIRHYTRKERNTEAIRNGLLMLLPLVLLLVSNRWTILSAGIWMLGIAIGGGLTWWYPYLTGKEAFKLPDGETWPHMYNRIFADTITVLPRRKNPNMPTPNLEHTILHSLMLVSGIAILIYSFKF